VGASPFTEGGADELDLLRITGKHEKPRIKRLGEVKGDGNP
jgi:hypothetical protein